MMEKLRMTAAEVNKALDEIEGYIREYGWEGRTVAPYGHAIDLQAFISGMRDYDRMTPDSKDIVIAELNGLIEHCINPWLKVEMEPKVTIRILKGKHAGETLLVPQSTADLFILDDLAEEVI